MTRLCIHRSHIDFHYIIRYDSENNFRRLNL